MKQAHFEYRCRRCGSIELNPHTGLPDGESRAISLLLDAMNGEPKETQAPTLLAFHSCGKGACGVADLIGYNITED